MTDIRTNPGGGAGTGAGARAVAAAVLMLGWVALLWALEGVDALTGHALDPYGISPRDPAELLDVVPAAFLHGGWDHLASNTVPLLVLGWTAALAGIRRFLGVVLTIVLTSGLGVWLTAPAHTVTLGASGVIFGLFGYLLVRGFVDRRALDVVIGVLVAVVYGSIVWGVLPTDSGISWQAHLFGLIGGVGAAFAFRRPRPLPYTGITA
ncbi:rhomboid family intramembrane serine protease [Streptomyces sp. NBC_00102]|uniref:rhomboid family intramembrane serine protease n=1 Tax=Streptomyces sp. NBC_00102 TaxID=2975652 RepID=UPI00225B200D|nr:rhomboid family intramembrane serine protease [Streptomyces sp. NBC_00102]MCX5398883.1 rhomboid family intramembrane serine protease [Streptomyces sp. NBC_00102]